MPSYHLPFVLASLLLVAACQPIGIPAPAGTALPATAASAARSETPDVMPTATAFEPTPTAVPPTPTPDAKPFPAEPAEQAANADVEYVRAVESADGTWTFHVTVRHPDTGWEDYADGWDVLTPDGTVLKPDPSSPFTRLLLHPHETEQPFTRSQSGIVIPPGAAQVRVRAHDLVDGFGGREVVVDLTVSSGPDFEVERK
jgi:hypothetical protein